jgi:hypothetical protein
MDYSQRLSEFIALFDKFFPTPFDAIGGEIAVITDEECSVEWEEFGNEPESPRGKIIQNKDGTFDLTIDNLDLERAWSVLQQFSAVG